MRDGNMLRLVVVAICIQHVQNDVGRIAVPHGESEVVPEFCVGCGQIDSGSRMPYRTVNPREAIICMFGRCCKISVPGGQTISTSTDILLSSSGKSSMMQVPPLNTKSSPETESSSTRANAWITRSTMALFPMLCSSATLEIHSGEKLSESIMGFGFVEYELQLRLGVSA